jgi:hypothetical protein
MRSVVQWISPFSGGTVYHYDIDHVHVFVTLLCPSLWNFQLPLPKLFLEFEQSASCFDFFVSHPSLIWEKEPLRKPLIMTESAYLKDELGPILARGLAAVSIARPADPVEYLGLWLLHQLQQKERKAQEVEIARKLETEREQWAKARALREKAATAVIQREWKAHVHAAQDAQRKEAQLRSKFAEIEETLEERVPEEHLPEGDRTEKERVAETDRLAAQTQFNRARLFVQQLDKSHVADFKALSPSNQSAVTVLKCCFYAQGCRPRQVDSWEKIRGLIKPYPFSMWLGQFNPCGSPLEKKRKMVRIRRLLTTVVEDDVKKTSAALHAVYSWLNAAANFRETRDEHIKVKKAAGKEVDEEYEEEEEQEDEEKDPQEETVKAAELEAQRAAEAEAAGGAEGEAAEEE